LEILRPRLPRGPFQAALFDFDGTLSLIRRNWQQVMVPLMVDVLALCPTSESRAELETLVTDFVTRLTGRQTIYQMMRLAEEVTLRGGEPLAPLEYKRMYHDRLWEQVSLRLRDLQSGALPPDALTIPGSRELLLGLQARSCDLFLASGTDLNYVQDEVRALQLDQYFGERIFGALDDYRKFSKALVLEQMTRELGYAGEKLVGFGDGFVEIEEIRKVGGLAVGVASDENQPGQIDRWKRQRLIEAGADVIIPDYQELGPLFDYLGWTS